MIRMPFIVNFTKIREKRYSRAATHGSFFVCSSDPKLHLRLRAARREARCYEVDVKYSVGLGEGGVLPFFRWLPPHHGPATFEQEEAPSF